MLWFFLSTVTALSVAARDVSVKALFSEKKVLEIAAYELFWATPFFAAGLILTPVPTLDATFWWAFIVSLPLNWVAYLLYIRAIKLSPLGLVIPLLAFTPAFMILTGYFFLGEWINLWGGMGILFVVIGSYILHMDGGGKGLLGPIRALLNDAGSRLMLAVALLYAFAATIGKKAIVHSSPLFFMYFFFLVFSCSLLGAMILTGRVHPRIFRSKMKESLWLGVLWMIHVSTHALAISMIAAVYMIAVKRSSILFTVLLGWLFLGEKNITARGIGAAFMFIGVLLITLLG